MHTFTPQQLRGGPRYGSASVLLGNWQAEAESEAAALRAFVAARDAGTLKSDVHARRMQTALQPVALTRAAGGAGGGDNFVRFGDVLQLVHVESGAALCVDVGAAAGGGAGGAFGESWACGAAANAQPAEPVARNTLLLSKYVASRPTPLEPSWEGDVVRYSQKLRLLAHPMAQGAPLDAAGGEAPLALFSRLLGVGCAARISRHQLVGYSWRTGSYDSVWEVQPPDPADRLALEGAPVAAGAPVLLLHAATQVPLSLEAGARLPSDFGASELEVTARVATSTGKQLTLERAARGDVAASLPRRPLSANIWAFVAGSEAAALPPGGAPALGALEAVLGRLAGLPERGLQALAALERKLLRLQAGASGCVSVQELVMALRQVGVELDEEEGAALARELAAMLRGCSGIGSGGGCAVAPGQVHVRAFLREAGGRTG